MENKKYQDEGEAEKWTMLLSPRAKGALLLRKGVGSQPAARGEKHGIRNKADVGLNLGVSAFLLDRDLTSLSRRGHVPGRLGSSQH